MTDPTLYHKISGPFKRSATDLKKVDVTKFVSPTVELLTHSDIWLFTEKIDGTNVRLIWDGHNLSYNGRSNNADLHKDLKKVLDGLWTERVGLEQRIEELFGEREVIIIGEGYGPGIQKGGGNYAAEKSFIAYDVMVDGKYLAYDTSRALLTELSIPALQAISEYPASLGWGIDIVANGLYSQFGNKDFYAEGLVAITDRPLYDNNGNRLIVKLKHEDLFDHEDLI